MLNLDKSIKIAGESYGIKIGYSEDILMETEKVKDWINTIENKLKTPSKNQKEKINFVFGKLI